MISQVQKIDGKTRSTGNNWRLIFNDDGGIRTVVKGSEQSTTYTLRDITETPLDVLPDTVIDDPEIIPDILAGMVLEGDLSEDEITALLDMYPKWDDLETGFAFKIDTLYVYNNTLYRVVQAHSKQADWTPDIVPALFTPAVPDTVIPVWVQPTGAHNSYTVDALVQWPEDGTVWRSTIPANVTEPGTLLPWGYWVEYSN